MNENDNARVILNALRSELFLKERQLESAFNRNDYDYEKIKELLGDCSNLSNKIQLCITYFKLDGNI